MIAIALHAAAWALQQVAKVLVPAHLNSPVRVARYAEVMATNFEHAGDIPMPETHPK